MFPKTKLKFFPVHFMKAYSGSTFVAPLISILSLVGDEW